MAFVITGPIVCLTMKSLLLLLLLRGKLYTCMTWQKGLLAYLDDEPVASQYLVPTYGRLVGGIPCM